MPSFKTFKDLSVTFKPHPITGDLITVKDEAAIKQAIVNLLLTNKSERFFNSNLGSGVATLLFQPLDYGTAALIQNEIRNTLNTYEPRIKVISVISNPDDENNGFDVILEYEIIGRDDLPKSVSFFLESSR